MNYATIYAVVNNEKRPRITDPSLGSQRANVVSFENSGEMRSSRGK
jgi:hypothetical protein